MRPEYPWAVACLNVISEVTAVSMEQPPRSIYQDDEISLVDLAKILIRRRWWFIVTFAAFILASGGWVLLQNGKLPIQENEYLYTSQLAVGYKAPAHLIEPMPSIVEQLNVATIPTVKQQNEQFTSLTAQVSFANNSNIVAITTTGDEKSVIVDFHEALMAPIIERHGRLQQWLSGQQVLTSQDGQVTQVIPTEVVALAVETQRAPEGQGVSSVLILGLGIVLGGVMGVMLAFFAEFVYQVRESIAAERK